MLGKLEDCMQLLVDSNQIPEAATNKVSEIVALWRKDLKKVNSVILTVCTLGTFMIVSRVDEIKYGCLEAFANKEAELNELRRSREYIILSTVDVDGATDSLGVHYIPLYPTLSEP
nr:coatomer subunit beta'-2-like [Tanacetum cinerariifolium]